MTRRSFVLRPGETEIVVMSSSLRMAVAAVLAIAVAAAFASSVSAKAKHHKQAPKEQYMRSAAPDPEKAQR
jgi:hypothetical protein